MESSFWFECKVALDLEENGKIKKVRQTYLVDSMTFADAEERITDEVGPLSRGEFMVEDIKRARYSELFVSDEEDDDKWYKARIDTLYVDIDTEKEKHISRNILVQAKTLEGAQKRLKQGMHGSVEDYVVMSIQETRIMDVLFMEA